MAVKRQLNPKDVIRLVAPGPVTLVSASYRDHPNLMTAGWLLPLSLDPTLIGVAIHPTRLTHEFITKTEQFAINIPTADLMTAVHTCGVLSGREGDKFALAGLTPGEAHEIEAPLVAECVAHIECGVMDRRSWGDHDLFIGQVLNVLALDEAFEGVWDVEVEAGQLLHHLGADRYAGLGRAYTVQTDEDRR
ncbi:MAG: flavin reductase family protein [Chloroflexota bacterium]|nr:flavin reductase family protein [Chloroflexota bacterium]